MTFDEYSNGRRTAVESKSNPGCNRNVRTHVMYGRCVCWTMMQEFIAKLASTTARNTLAPTTPPVDRPVH